MKRRKSIRLEGFDYTAEGAYFVTIVTHKRNWLFGDIINDEMVLSEYGKVVDLTWQDLPNHNTDVATGAFVIMPNHIHGIIHLFPPLIVGVGSKPTPNIPSRAGYEPAPTGSSVPLPEIVRQLKTFSAKRINALRGTPGATVWQRNYYDHIIRNDKEYALIERYIQENPIHWATDEENENPLI